MRLKTLELGARAAVSLLAVTLLGALIPAELNVYNNLGGTMKR